MQESLSYQSDNAALLYYQAFLIMDEKDCGKMRELAGFAAGDFRPNERLEEFVQRYRRVIDLVAAGAGKAYCDWGLDFSKGASVVLPHLTYSRNAARLVCSHARIAASRNSCREAIEKCLITRKFGNHCMLGDLICGLSGVAAVNLAYSTIRSVLEKISNEMETILWLKDRFVQSESHMSSFRNCLETELAKMNVYMKKSTAEKAIPDFYEWARQNLPDDVAEYAKNSPDEFFRQNENYWNDYKDRLRAALDLPCKEAQEGLLKLQEEMKQNFENPHAVLTDFWSPNFLPAYHVFLCLQNHYNAVRAAIELYILFAQTGRLPARLPENMPQDLFSGEAFEYTQTGSSFTLASSCKDLRNKTMEYAFGIVSQ